MPVASVAFVLAQRYRVYDGVQADVSDHLLAIVSEFGLGVFRTPTGTDVHRLAFAADRRPGPGHRFAPACGRPRTMVYARY